MVHSRMHTCTPHNTTTLIQHNHLTYFHDKHKTKIYNNKKQQQNKKTKEPACNRKPRCQTSPRKPKNTTVTLAHSIEIMFTRKALEKCMKPSKHIHKHLNKQTQTKDKTINKRKNKKQTKTNTTKSKQTQSKQTNKINLAHRFRAESGEVSRQKHPNEIVGHETLTDDTIKQAHERSVAKARLQRSFCGVLRRSCELL